MFIDYINLNHLRIFESVYRTRNMTTAAEELHLTQSGVSQHIQTLEEAIGVKLFDRIKKKLLPTPQAEVLYGKCRDGFLGIEQALSTLKGGDEHWSGSVSIGMPPEFGSNAIIPKLAEFGKKHPEMNFKAVFGFATEMSPLLLQGELDFAFVDALDLDQQISVEEVSHESLYLCASSEYLKAKGWRTENRESFERFDYVTFLRGEGILENWFNYHFKWKHPNLKIRGSVKDVQEVAKLILLHFGVGILPGHLLKRLEKQGHHIHRFKGSGLPLRNTISLAFLKGRTLSPLAQGVLKQLRESF